MVSEVNLSRRTYEKTEENSGPILTDFLYRARETRKRYRVYVSLGGAMVIFIYEETTMKRDPPSPPPLRLDKPCSSNLLGFPQVEFSWSACPGRVET